MKVHGSLLATFMLIAPGTANACSNPTEPSFLQQLKTAKTVAVVRLISLKLTSTASNSKQVEGQFLLIQTLKGQPTFSKISYVDEPCGGVLPAVGRYYAIATRSSDKTLRLVRGDNSIIDINSDFADTYPPLPEKSKMKWHIANLLNGVPLPQRLADRFEWLNIHGAPPPAPPLHDRVK